MVGLADHGHKLPSATSGGQQQRVAIARSLANDPALIVCDEPTGNLDTGNAQAMLRLFKDLRNQGKTIIMVTHDDELAQQSDQVFILDNGVLVNEYLSTVFEELHQDEFEQLIKHAQISEFAPGTTIIQEGTVGDEFYVVLEGMVDIYIKRSNREVLVDRLDKGRYFGEMALIGDNRRRATVRCSSDEPTKLASINLSTFQHLMTVSEPFRYRMEALFHQHQQQELLSTKEIEIPAL